MGRTSVGRAVKHLIQYAALPYTVTDGQPMVMLVTSRETRRWILPKGRPERDLAPHDVAAREAFEEAGLKGRVVKRRFATFPSVKRLKSGEQAPCTVDVFLLEVGKVLDEWPERKERDRRWVTPGEAAMLVGEPGLVQVMLDFSALFA